MSSRPRLVPRLLLLTACALPSSLASAQSAGTQSAARECIAAHEDGQVQLSAGQLLGARDEFLQCAAERCPSIVRKECLALQESVQAALPSIVLAATDGRGRDVSGASAVIDGVRRIESLDGRALELDPGPHSIEFLLSDGRRQTLQVTLREAEKYRRISASFRVPRTSSTKENGGAGPSPVAYVLAGVGVVALGSFVVFGLDGNSKQRELERTCAPNCTQSKVDEMRRSHLIADISLGVSVAALATGTYLFVAGSSSDDSAQRGHAGRELAFSVSGAF